MRHKGRSVIGYKAQIVIGFLVGVAYWKWQGEDAKKRLKK